MGGVWKNMATAALLLKTKVTKVIHQNFRRKNKNFCTRNFGADGA